MPPQTSRLDQRICYGHFVSVAYKFLLRAFVQDSFCLSVL